MADKYTCFNCGGGDGFLDGPFWVRRRTPGKRGFRFRQICVNCSSEDGVGLHHTGDCIVCGQQMFSDLLSGSFQFPTICSDDCKRLRHNQLRREARKQPVQACQHCGDPLVGMRDGTKFCSLRCRVAAHRAA